MKMFSAKRANDLYNYFKKNVPTNGNGETSR